MVKPDEPLWFSPAIFWGFGVATCAFYAISTLQVCAQESGMLALFWPLLLIPLSNAATLLLAQQGRSSRTLAILCALNGIACAVSVVLTIILAPLCLLACAGLAIGLFIWPAFLFCAYHLLVAVGPIYTSFAMRNRLLRLKEKQPIAWLPMGTAAAITLTLVLLALLPTRLTQQCLASARDHGEMQKQAVLLLRAFGDNETMLRSCYKQDLVLPWWFQMGHGPLSSSILTDSEMIASRELFYRSTGNPFNSAKRPTGTEYYYGWEDEIDWWNDHDFAGATVGGVVRGLTLTNSKVDGWVDADEAISRLNWKMHFTHDTASRAELRAEILLPPQAVVSGCALWINGIRHDALIGTRNSTRGAYQTSAERGERPFMVSTAGPGRVLIQSSTGWWGNDVDLEVDITAPVTVTNKDSASLRLPMFAERNFGITTPHFINLATTSMGVNSPVTKELKDISLKSAEGTLQFQRDPQIVRLRGQAPYLDKGSEVVEVLQTALADKNVPTCIVIDGSASMGPFIHSACKALSKANFSDASIVWASDSPQTVISHANTNSVNWHNALSKLEDAGCVGGQDNAEALMQALQTMPGEEALNIVWIHGPQPAKLPSDKFPQELAKSNAKIFEYQVAPAPNELIRSLDHSQKLVQVANFKTTEADLKDLFAKLSGEQQQTAMTGSLEPAGSSNAQSARHGNELSQIFINQLILSKLDDQTALQELGELAQKASIVTPLTSALVLETKESYEAYGVKQYSKKNGTTTATLPKDLLGSAAGLIPTKPEPPMSLLIACAMMIFAGLIWIRRKFTHA